MATIKSYTDINQSRKLSEILPLESADMYYLWYIEEDRDTIKSGHRISIPSVGNFIHIHKVNKMILPCWSLAALLSVLPDGIGLFKTVDGEFYCLSNDYMTNYYDSPIDACYELILRLNELNLL